MNPFRTRQQPGLDPRQIMADPALAAPYPLLTRWRDYRAGTRDGRAGLPDLSAGAGYPTMAYLRGLEAHTLEACEVERLAAQSDTVGAQAELAPLAAQIQTHQHHLDAARAQRNSRTEAPDAATLVARGPAEQHATAEAITARRLAEHRRGLAAADGQIAAAAAAVDTLKGRAEALRAGIDIRFATAGIRVCRLHELGMRRTAVYLRAFTRRHPEDRELHTWAAHYALRTPQWPAPGPWQHQLVTSRPDPTP